MHYQKNLFFMLIMRTSLIFSSERIIKLPCATWTQDEARQFEAIEKEFHKLNHKYGNMLPFGEKKSPLSFVDENYHKNLKEQLLSLAANITNRTELEDSTQQLQGLAIKEEK